MTDVYDIRVLEPKDVLFSRGSGGVFQGVVGGVAYDELVVYRTFPFLYTTQYISVRTAQGEELGIVADIAELDDESSREALLELQYRYFLPRVTRVESVKQKADMWIWELATSLGSTRMVMRNLHEHMQFPGGNRIILTDMNGRRVEIADWRTLDAHSRKQLNDVV